MQENVRHVAATRTPACSPACLCFPVPGTKRRVSKHLLGSTEAPCSPRAWFSKGKLQGNGCVWWF